MFRHLSGKFVSNGKYTLVKPFSSQHLAKKKKCFRKSSEDREIISKEVQVRSRIRFSSESSGRSDMIFFTFSDPFERIALISVLFARSHPSAQVGFSKFPIGFKIDDVISGTRVWSRGACVDIL